MSTQCVHVGVVHRDFALRHASRALVVVFWRNSPALHREPTTSETAHSQTKCGRYQLYCSFLVLPWKELQNTAHPTIMDPKGTDVVQKNKRRSSHHKSTSYWVPYFGRFGILKSVRFMYHNMMFFHLIHKDGFHRYHSLGTPIYGSVGNYHVLTYDAQVKEL